MMSIKQVAPPTEFANSPEGLRAADHIRICNIRTMIGTRR